jgi:regulator of sigma E protease
MFLMSALNMFLIYIASFFVVLSIIVFVHELGHFLVARWCGVRIDTFSIGFGKEIAGWNDRHGTRWKLCWILLGGYVKFAGDANAASLPSNSAQHVPGSLYSKPVWQRMAVVAAGPIANFLLAIAIFSSVYMAYGVPNIDPVIAEVNVGSAAERAGFKAGDRIMSVDGSEVRSFSDFVQYIALHGTDTLNIAVSRGGANLTIRATPDIVIEPDGFGGQIRKPLLGVKSQAAVPGAEHRRDRLGPIDALRKGAGDTWNIISMTMRFLGKLFSGSGDPKQVGSVISMAKGAGDAASDGVANFAFYIAFLSVSVGLINLFPIPMLDGGHLVFYTIESVIGKPLSQRAQEIGFRLGLSLVFMMMAFGMWNDLTRIFAMILGS